MGLAWWLPQQWGFSQRWDTPWYLYRYHNLRNGAFPRDEIHHGIYMNAYLRNGTFTRRKNPLIFYGGIPQEMRSLPLGEKPLVLYDGQREWEPPQWVDTTMQVPVSYSVRNCECPRARKAEPRGSYSNIPTSSFSPKTKLTNYSHTITHREIFDTKTILFCQTNALKLQRGTYLSDSENCVQQNNTP